MPNIATALRDEIKRLSRQQSRTQIDPTKRATAVHRRDIALLKRQVVLLEAPSQIADAPRAEHVVSSASERAWTEGAIRCERTEVASRPPGSIRGRSWEGAGR